jgi:hypothetical protein
MVTSSSLTILTICWAGLSAWLEQRDPDLAGSGVDVGLGEPALAAQALERVGEAVGECGEQVKVPSN